MRLKLIVAFDEDMTIGKDGKLPWNIKEDLKHFKKVTTGNVVLMGRKTYQSIGKPLPDRINVVFTKDKEIHSNEKLGLYYVSSMNDYYMLLPKIKTNRDIYVIGGRQIYTMFLPYADELIITHVKGHFEGDTKFPMLDLSKWIIHKEIEGKDFSIKYYKRYY